MRCSNVFLAEDTCHQVYPDTSGQTGLVRKNVRLERCDEGLQDLADLLMLSKSECGRDRSIRSSGAHLEEEDDESELSCTTRIEEAQDLRLFSYVGGRGRGPCGSVLRLQFLREMFLRTLKHSIMSQEVGSISRVRARRTPYVVHLQFFVFLSERFNFAPQRNDLFFGLAMHAPRTSNSSVALVHGEAREKRNTINCCTIKIELSCTSSNIICYKTHSVGEFGSLFRNKLEKGSPRVRDRPRNASTQPRNRQPC